MAILQDIEILQYQVPQGADFLRVDFPGVVLPGNWNRVEITLTNNYVDQTFPLTNADVIIEFGFTLTKGQDPVGGVLANQHGGQLLDKTGNTFPRKLTLLRPEAASGSIRLNGFIIFFTDVEIGFSAEYF